MPLLTIDYYYLITKPFVTLQDIKSLVITDKEAEKIFHKLKKISNKINIKYKKNQIPNKLIIDYFNLDVNRIIRYHNEVKKFYKL